MHVFALLTCVTANGAAPPDPIEWRAGDQVVSLVAPSGWGALHVAPAEPDSRQWVGDHALSRATFDGVPGLVWTVHRYDAQQVDDPGVARGDIAASAKQKQADVALFEALYAKRQVDTVLRSEHDDRLGAVDVLAPHELFWGEIDSFVTVHAAEPIANRAGDLRGVLLFGTGGQDYGFEPEIFVWVGDPARRIVVTARVSVAGRPELATLPEWPARLAAGDAYFARVVQGTRGDAIGALLGEVEGVVGSLSLK